MCLNVSLESKPIWTIRNAPNIFILIGAFLCELFVCGKLLNTLVENDSSPIHLEERGQTDGRDGRDGREIVV